MIHQDWEINIFSSEQSKKSKVANPFAEPLSSQEVVRPLKNKTGTACQLFTYVASVTGKLNITGATSWVPLNTTLRPRPVGPAVHSAQKLSPQLTCKIHVLSVGVRNQNLVASFSLGREVTWVGQQWGDVLTSGIAFLSFHLRHSLDLRRQTIVSGGPCHQ